ncbi:MAG TPA: hypothetical protein VNO70_26795 [Blastocatellia bacterium]|nr:hypothetical protein [Blastocatellia bacterium]
MMKRFALCCVSLVIMLALTTLTNGSASAMSANNSRGTTLGRAQDDDKLRAEIKKLEEKQKELKDSVEAIEDILSDVEKNKKVLVRVPGFALPLPVDKDEYASLLDSLTQTGRLSAQAADRQWKKALNASTIIKKSLERELQKLKSRQDATEEKLSSYRDERARLADAEDEEPSADAKSGKGKEDKGGKEEVAVKEEKASNEDAGGKEEKSSKDEKGGKDEKSKESESSSGADEKAKAKAGESGGRADAKEKAKGSKSGERTSDKTAKLDTKKASAAKKTGQDKPVQVAVKNVKAAEKEKAKAGDAGAGEKAEKQDAKNPDAAKKTGEEKPPQEKK